MPVKVPTFDLLFTKKFYFFSVTHIGNFNPTFHNRYLKGCISHLIVHWHFDCTHPLHYNMALYQINHIFVCSCCVVYQLEERTLCSYALAATWYDNQKCAYMMHHTKIHYWYSMSDIPYPISHVLHYIYVCIHKFMLQRQSVTFCLEQVIKLVSIFNTSI